MKLIGLSLVIGCSISSSLYTIGQRGEITQGVGAWVLL